VTAPDADVRDEPAPSFPIGSPRLWRLVFVVGTGVGLFNFAVVAAALGASRTGGFERALVEEMSGAWLATPFIALLIAVAIRLPLPSRRWPRRVAVYFAASVGCAAGAIAVFLTVRSMVWPALGWGEYPLGDLRYRLAMEYLKQVLGHSAVIAATTLFTLTRRARAREVRAAELERELVEAKLRALQMQIEPHFLFNALNLVSSCIRLDARRAETMLAQLSDFLRATLRAGDAQEVRLEQELAVTSAYLEIMRARFVDRLRVEIDAPAETRRALVPNLILQPLVENAVKHGIARHDRVGTVRIAAERDGDALRLTVADDGPGAPAEGLPVGRGVGLTNTAERLAHLHGAAARLAAGEAPGGGLQVVLWVPWRVAEAAA
jgi:two-component system, LytTR family, sensor kinase